MESRKLISFGSSSYVVSIPKGWIQQNNLVKGDSLYVDQRGSELVFQVNTADQKRPPKMKQVDATNKTIDRIRAEIVTTYLNNYNQIEVRHINDDNAKKIKDIIQNLAGMEIMEQTSNKIVTKDLIDLKELSIKALIRRMDIIVRSMMDDALDAFDKDNIESLYQRDTDVNRLFYLTRRLMTAVLEDPKIAKDFDTDACDVIADWEVAVRIEKVGDQCKRIAKTLKMSRIDKEVSKEVEDIFRNMKERYLQVMKHYYCNDKENGYNMEVGMDDMILRSNQLIVDNSSPQMITLCGQFKSMASALRFIARSITMFS